MSDKHRYTFSESEVSEGGKFSAKMACLSLVLFVVDVLISAAGDGEAAAFTGAIGLTAAALAVYGFFIGMKSFNERDVSPTFSIIGSISSGVIAVGWLTIFLTGLI